MKNHIFIFWICSKKKIIIFVLKTIIKDYDIPYFGEYKLNRGTMPL